LLFHIYELLLLLSGVAMLGMASVKTGQATTRRIWNAVFGAGMAIYGLYLLIFFQGGHYVLFFYVFALPIIMGIRFFRDRSAFRARKAAATVHGMPPGYGQPSGDRPQGFIR
jgi:hypothetical protein